MESGREAVVGTSSVSAQSSQARSAADVSGHASTKPAEPASTNTDIPVPAADIPLTAVQGPSRAIPAVPVPEIQVRAEEVQIPDTRNDVLTSQIPAPADSGSNVAAISVLDAPVPVSSAEVLTPIVATPIPVTAKPSPAPAVAGPSETPLPPRSRSFRDAMLGNGGEGSPTMNPETLEPEVDFNSEEMRAKHLPLIQGNRILISPEAQRTIVPRTLDLVTRELQSRRIVSLPEPTFELAMRALSIPAQLCAKIGYGRWNILLPSVGVAKTLAAKVLKYTAPDKKSYLFQPEYLGCRKTKIVVMGAPAFVYPNTLAVLFSQFGRVESVKREKMSLGGTSGRCTIQVYLPLDKIQDVPSKLALDGDIELVVIVEGRRPACWKCGKQGHIAKDCPLKISTVENEAPAKAPAKIVQEGWQTKGKKATPSAPVESAPAPVTTQNRWKNLPEPEVEESPMDSSTSRKRSREEAGNAAASKTSEKKAHTPVRDPSPCGSKKPDPVKGPPSPPEPRLKKKAKKVDSVPAPEPPLIVITTSPETDPTPTEAYSSTPSQTPPVVNNFTPTKTTRKDTVPIPAPTKAPDPVPAPTKAPDPVPAPTKAPDPVPTAAKGPDPVPAPDPVKAPDPVPDPAEAQEPVKKTKKKNKSKNKDQKITPDSPVEKIIPASASSDVSISELFSFSDFLDSEDDVEDSSSAQADRDSAVPIHRRPFPFQTGRNICKVDKRLKYGWTELTGEPLKALLNFTRVGKGKSAKDVENPLLFPDAPFLITTVRVSKDARGVMAKAVGVLSAADFQGF